MERIKEALERARQERQQSPAGSQSFPAQGEPATSEQISYTQTRTMKISPSTLAKHRVIAGVPAEDVTDSYGLLRTQVLQRLSENNWNALAITSPGEQEGKTLTAINLAISLAMEVNYTVLLVDADLREPSIHKHFNLKPELGLSDYLTGDVNLQDILIHPEGIGHCVVLPGGKSLPNSSELLNSPKMVQLVDELKRRYPSRIVVFDLPPLLTAPDALAFSPYIDAALLVVEEGKTKVQDLERATELLQGTTLLGTVLNKSSSVSTRSKGKTGWLGRLFSPQH